MESMGLDVRDLLDLLAGIAARGAVLLGLVALVTRTARRRSASLRHGLWAAAVAGHLVLPFVGAILPRWQVAVLPPVDRAPIPAALRSTAGPTPARVEGIGSPTTLANDSRHPSGSLASEGPRILVALWAFGAALLLARRMGAELKLRRWVAAAREVSDPRRIRAMNDAVQALGLRRPVPLLETDRAPVPMVSGAWNPRIVLPTASASWDPDTLRGVLLHELAHVRRGDIRWNLLAYLGRALFWFDPLTWLAVRRMRIEGERAADDAVLAAGERPSGYAAMLLELASAAGRSAPAAALALVGDSGLDARIDAVLAHRDRRSLARRQVMAGVLILTAGVGVLAAVEPGRSAATAAAPASRPARFENPSGSPVQIQLAEVQAVTGVGGRPGEVRLTRARLR